MPETARLARSPGFKRSATPIAGIWRHVQDPAHNVSQCRWPPIEILRCLQHEIAQVLGRVLPDDDFFGRAVAVAFGEGLFGCHGQLGVIKDIITRIKQILKEMFGVCRPPLRQDIVSLT